MGKYDIYIENLKKEESFNKEQDRLHNKHSDIDENKVIVEKSNTIKNKTNSLFFIPSPTFQNFPLFRFQQCFLLLNLTLL